jgi:hypothetical protein
MKNVVFWDVTPCGCCKNRRFGGTYRLHYRGGKVRRARKNVSSKHAAKKYSHIVFLRSVLRLLITNNVVPHSSILVTPMTNAMRSSETSFLTRAT